MVRPSPFGWCAGGGEDDGAGAAGAGACPGGTIGMPSMVRFAGGVRCAGAGAGGAATAGVAAAGGCGAAVGGGLDAGAAPGGTGTPAIPSIVR